MATAFLLTLLVLTLVIVVLSRAYGEINEEFVKDWARAHSLKLTKSNRPFVWWYLRNARVLRTWGTVAGIVLPPLAAVAVGMAGQGVSTTWWCIFAGHLAGALYSEVALRRPWDSGPRTATLEPRELAQYLPARLRYAPAAITATATFLVAIAFATGDLTSSTTNSAAITILGATGLAVVLYRVQRWILARPQPLADADMIAADDAIRSQSLHMLAGSGSAVILAIFGALFSTLSMDTAPPISTLTALLGIATVPMSIISCLYYGHRAWSVQRTPAPQAAVVA